jgi:hypothetical protein
MDRKKLSWDEVSTNVLTYVLSIFKKLRYLEIDSPSSPLYAQRLSFENISPPFFSSTLMELYTNVCSFDDCLYLLDGRFNQLRTFHVKISMVLSSSSRIDNKVGYWMKIR